MDMAEHLKPLSSLCPSQKGLDQSHFMNPHLPLEVTYTGEERVSELPKTPIPQAVSYSSRIENLSLWIRANVSCFQMPALESTAPGLRRAAPVMGHGSTLRPALCFLRLTSVVLFSWVSRFGNSRYY